jgi:transposase InsO family protein
MNVHSRARTCPASRALLVQRIREECWEPAEAAEACGVSVRTAYKWLARYRDEGVPGLRDRSSRPRCMPTRMPDEWRTMILELRAGRMTGRRIAAQLGRPYATVARILQRAGVGRLQAPAVLEPVRRYERAEPGELLHIDVKKLGRFARPGHRIHGDPRTRVRGVGWEYVHVAIDDASRVAYAEVLRDERAATSVVPFLRRAVAYFARLGVRVQRVMTDNGSAYRSRRHAHQCARLKLKHLRTRPYTPRTNGKVERMIQTLLREWAYALPFPTSSKRAKALKPWLEYYNRQRPHSALGHRPPFTRLPSQMNNVMRLHS